MCSLFQVCVFWSYTADGDANSFCAGIVSCGFTNYSVFHRSRVVIISDVVLYSQGVIGCVEVTMSLGCFLSKHDNYSLHDHRRTDVHIQE